MYQSFQYDPYDSFYYPTINESFDECHSPEFRVRAQTWAGNEICRTQPLLPQINSFDPYSCCLDSLNSNEDSLNSQHNYCATDKIDEDSTESSHLNGCMTKKTSRKNPWGQETYADLIEQAISAYPSKMATLQQIYDHIAKNHAYFQERNDATSSAGWKNSIRHNLSLHDKFLKCPKKNENMKSSLWSINHSSFKRTRSNSMDCKNTSNEIVTKRRVLKEQRRSTASNSNITSEPKRSTSIRSKKSDKCPRPDSFVTPFVSNDDVFTEKSPDFFELEPEQKYMPPDIVPCPMISQRDYELHEDLGRLEVNSMEPIYNYEDQYYNYERSAIPNFHVAAREYSIFVAELFND